NMLASVTLPDSSVHSYAYDYRVRRITRTEGSANPVAMTFSGGLSVAEFEVTDPQLGTLNTQPAVEYQRGPDMGGGVGGLLYSLRSGTAKFNLSNGRGDVVAQSDSTGDLTWTASYEAYGKRPMETGTNADRQRANTKEEDPTGLLNEGYRYRDLETDVWLSKDPAGFVDGPNLYAYVRQNPWTSWDPDGLATRSELAKQKEHFIAKLSDTDGMDGNEYRLHVQNVMSEVERVSARIQAIDSASRNVNQAIAFTNFVRENLYGLNRLPYRINPDDIDDSNPFHSWIFEQGNNFGKFKSDGAAAVLGGALSGISKTSKLVRRTATRGIGAAHMFDEAFAANRYYVASPKHTGAARTAGGAKINPAPADGQGALDFSFPVSENTTRRIGVDTAHNQLVVFDRTQNVTRGGRTVGGEYHGHVRTWDELSSPMQKALSDYGVSVSKKGEIKLDPKTWGFSDD
ncbi:RHS repeat-associated protein, partial [Roseimicrobium gellanilyticum]